MRGTARRSLGLGAMGVVILLATGCATQQEAGRIADQDYSGVVSAREYGYVRPAVDVLVTQRGSGDSRTISSRSRDGNDLWSRVRSGMQLDLYANQRIDATVERFRRDPNYLSRMSERANPYIHVIVNEIERRGLPMELAFLPHVESRFNPQATSPKSAAGIWQFMPYTGREMGLRQDHWYDGRRDLLTSTAAALDYLEQLNRRFDGDWALAMAAYNCGPGCVAAAQANNRRQGRPTDFWSLDLPNETKQYVPQILATARLVSAPTRYGINLPALPDHPQLEVVRSNQSIDLHRVAMATGVQLSELQRLNPALKQGRTGPEGPGHVLIPAGAGQRINRKKEPVQVMPATAFLASSYTGRPAHRTRSGASTVKVHRVRAGETLVSIAKEYGIDRSTLAETNGLSPRDTLLPGQTLRVAVQGGNAPVTHLVEEGDSIKKIARRYGVTVKEIQRWNGLDDKRVQPGDLLVIYAQGKSARS